MPHLTRPQLALYAAAAIAVLLIGARFLRSQDGGGSGGGFGAAPSAEGGAGGAAGGGLASGGGSSGDAGGSASGAAGSHGGAPGAGADGSLASGEAGGAAADGQLVVDVKGAVRRPGVYRLETGARALDAVREAGGITRRADRLGVNLAARVTDGGEVVVPSRGVGGAGAGRGAALGGSAAGGSEGTSGDSRSGPLTIDINTATAQELEQLDGVGPATAAKIVAYREEHGGFSSIDELDQVSGIGEARLAAIRTQLGL